MSTLKSWWAGLLQYSVAIATIMVLTFAALGLLLVVGVAVVAAKISVFVR